MAGKEQVTIYDVAQKAGVSITTVSRVLAESPLVSTKTRKRVRRALDELGYVPNAIARSLASKTSSTIGVLVSDITNPYFTEVLSGIEDVTYGKGYYIFLCNTGYSREKVDRYILQLLENRTDGIILLDAFVGSENLIERLQKSAPVVSVQASYEDIDCIVTDDEHGAFVAVDYLIQRGHSKIGFLIYDAANPVIEARLRGYKRAFRKNGIPIDEDLIIRAPFSPLCGYEMTNLLLDRFPEVTAVFTYNDQMAVHAYYAISSRSLSIPGDISVVGFDDIKLASLMKPGLTTVGQKQYDIGRTAAELVLRRIEEKNERFSPQTIQFKTNLIERGSTRAR